MLLALVDSQIKNGHRITKWSKHMYVSSQKLRLQILLNALTQPGFLSTFTCIYCQRVDLANVVISDTAQAMKQNMTTPAV